MYYKLNTEYKNDILERKFRKSTVAITVEHKPFCISHSSKCLGKVSTEIIVLLFPFTVETMLLTYIGSKRSIATQIYEVR